MEIKKFNQEWDIKHHSEAFYYLLFSENGWRLRLAPNLLPKLFRAKAL